MKIESMNVADLPQKYTRYTDLYQAVTFLKKGKAIKYKPEGRTARMAYTPIRSNLVKRYAQGRIPRVMIRVNGDFLYLIWDGPAIPRKRTKQ